MTWWIVGKNSSMLTFPSGFFTARDSIGINHAAMWCKTRMAFSAYPRLIDEFLASGFVMDNIIGVRPKHNIPGQHGYSHWPNLYHGIQNDPIFYNNHDKGSISDIPSDVKSAVSGDSSHAFRNRDTSMHLLVMWCVLHKKYPLNICGCNQSRLCASGKDEYPDAALLKSSREYTEALVKCLNDNGIVTRLFDDYAAVAAAGEGD